MRRTLNAISAALLTLTMLATSPMAARAAEGGLSFTVAPVLERLVESHTSYEFGNPIPPVYSPLSRLEFPLDSWWGGARVSLEAPRWSVNLQGLTNLSGEADGQMKDTDWDEPGLVTIYSESDCRLNRSWMVTGDADLDVSPWLGLPRGLRLAPVAGLRFQEFRFTAHDGTQWEYENGVVVDTIPLPGDAINFRQRFWHYFLGLRIGIQSDPDRPGPRLALTGQLDWAYVQGFNRDHHLLRQGYRLTEETTRGHAWHGGLTFDAWLSKRLSLSLAAEYMYIHTTGSHRWLNEPLGFDMTSDTGVKVWSEQMSVSAYLSWLF